MLITNILTAATTACAIFAPAAAAYDMRVKKYGKTDCSSSGGGNLDWNANECHALYSTDWGMKVIDYDTKCKMRGYNNGNCRGSAVTAFSTRQCHSLKGVWSVRVECE
ncbi:hypothetical protein CPAR01_05096 [Colletotrichum paranaense]|nr:uncharacterized protein CLUP02_12446 [Colletotrichum lupini]XP_053053991.1 uncharacterized protein COL516b_000954 [Colletotrichum fioriniae]XP_060350841.1 uncharacterized protein CPAR01_05096 [Colletotrichum paranaense]XP_060365792.1 uncharacterized protein BDZ83DRAFT_751384 [Colletotrichum acutatum]XP_060382576.1 uncharacterized protein CTAM01_06705 [Colletotrichum tamarilloi]XP_060393399.1 uncharacterized protein CABS01_14353 [Colletotrichum abscissum]EXF77151.1 hypothetical protein CFIO